MSKKPDSKLISQLLERGVSEVIVRSELQAILESGKKIKLYLGIDPTGSKLHLGHTIALRKLRDFQNLGHHVVFLVGSFTALIGDTSDKDSMRPVMTQAQIDENFRTYKEQASKILDFSKTEILYNGEWLSKLTFKDILELANKFTVQQMIERDMYQKRIQEGKPIGLHEFLYPLMQGYDSVAMNVDLEVGGNDQLFNMLAGRTLQKHFNNHNKHVMTVQLLEGIDGRKMAKTYGNFINITDSSDEMFGRLMSISDELIVRYLTLCTDLSLEEIEAIEKEIKSGGNPRDAKVRLAKEIITLYHSSSAADKAEANFINVFQKNNLPDDIPLVRLDATVVGSSAGGRSSRTDPSGSVKGTSSSQPINIVDLLTGAHLVSSKGEARRLIEQGGVKVDQKKIESVDANVDLSNERVVQVGKRKFVRVVL